MSVRRRMLRRCLMNRAPLRGRRAVVRIRPLRLPVRSSMYLMTAARTARIRIRVRVSVAAIGTVMGRSGRPVIRPMRGTRLLLAVDLVAPDCLEMRAARMRIIVRDGWSAMVRHDRMQIVSTVEDLLTPIAVAVEVAMTMSVGSCHPDIGLAADKDDIAVKRRRDVDVVGFGYDLFLNHRPGNNRRRRGHHNRRSSRRGRRLANHAWRCTHATRDEHCTCHASDQRRPSHRFQTVLPRGYWISLGLTAPHLES